jgi:hypothetical protein
MAVTMTTKYSAVTGLPLADLPGASAPTQYYRNRSSHKAPNFDLQALLEKGHNRYYEFTATDEEFISVMGAVDSGNALLLLHHGLRSEREVTDFLLDHRMESLSRAYSNIAEAALESGLDPVHLLEFMDSTDSKERNSEHAADAVRTLALEKQYKDVRHIGSLSRLVLSGEARYEDIKTIGAAKVHRNSDMLTLAERLHDLASGEQPFTAHHVLAAIERRMAAAMDKEVGEQLLDLIKRYGGDTGLSVQNPVQVRHIPFVADTVAEELELLPYADAVYTLRPDLEAKMADINRLRKHGISTQDAARGLSEGRSAQQIVAMKDGVEEALTDGWL